MIFDIEYNALIEHHLARRTGERRGRLERGHRHAEALFLKQVWWPLRGNFNGIHPEYEVLDWRGKSFFADLAWFSGPIKLLIEIKGFNPHVRDMDRQKYCNELNRETFLHAMGYQVISFAYDDVEQHPELCITLLRMILMRYQPSQSPVTRSMLAEKEIIRLANQLAQPIRPIDVEHHLGISHRTAVSLLQKCCQKGLLTPSPRGSGERNVRYSITPEAFEYL